MPDTLSTFGTLQTVEFPSDGPGLANDATPKAPLGVTVRYNGNLYRYVKFDDGTDSVASAAGKVAYWKSLDPANGTFTVTCDVSSAIASGVNMCAGVFGTAVTDGYYTWIQISGVAPNTVCAASVVAGDKLKYGGDGAFSRAAAGTAAADEVFGIALEAVDPTYYKGDVLLMNMDW